MEFSFSKCYFCGSLDKALSLESYFDDKTEYKLFECVNCHVQYWVPFKNPGPLWYEKDLNYMSRNKDPDMEPNWHQKKTVFFLGSHKGRILDVGCGTGTFIFWARKRGWEVCGIDFDRNAIYAAKETFKLNNVYNVDLTNYVAMNLGLKFDLITFFDVFEHIDNHHDFLREIGNLLVPNGHIAMSMPYRRGARWLNSGDLPPRHLTRWDRATITRYLEQEGFKIVYIRRLSEGLGFLVTKLRRKYGKYVSMNIVGRLKSRARRGGKIDMDSKMEKSILHIHKLARVKDWIIFGIPAFFVFLFMLFTPKRYITLFVIAQKK